MAKLLLSIKPWQQHFYNLSLGFARNWNFTHLLITTVSTQTPGGLIHAAILEFIERRAFQPISIQQNSQLGPVLHQQYKTFQKNISKKEQKISALFRTASSKWLGASPLSRNRSVFLAQIPSDGSRNLSWGGQWVLHATGNWASPWTRPPRYRRLRCLFWQ